MTREDVDGSGSDPSELFVGIDIGGTFTDIISFEPASEWVDVTKVPSTPENPARGVIDGLEAVFSATDYGPADVSILSHGSTVTINTLIERSGAKTGLLLTDGFDAIPIAGRGERPEDEVKNPRYVPPTPLIRHRHVMSVDERIGSEGEVVEPLDEASARRAIERLRDRGIESIAVAFLFSFLNPAHERRVAELIEEVHPAASTTLSSDISPRIREYPRTSTAMVNAYVDPVLSEYIADLQDRLEGVGVVPDSLTMMLSHGGLAKFEDALGEPASTVLSGPAAGVQGAVFAAELAGASDIVTMDMGGTSCDIAIAPDCESLVTTEKEIMGNPITVPMVDINAIGAGGGTIARVEEDRLQVGPDSAGADPGPVCYGQGGEMVTITDANVVLGRLNPDAILGGDLAIDDAGAERAVRDQVADPLGLSVTEAAAGIVRVVNDKMKKELALALTQKGHDPRKFSLVAYGGAGPMHAPAIARELSIRSIVIPPWPGINSAVGLLSTDRKQVYERSKVERLEAADLGGLFEQLEADALADIDDDLDVSFRRELELRYAGQSYELTLDVEPGEGAESLRERFDATHEEMYGHVSDQSLETMTYRTTAILDTEKITGDVLRDEDASDGSTEPADHRSVYFGDDYRDTPILRRDQLATGTELAGPAIVEQADTTTVVDPWTTVRVGEYGNLVLDLGGEGR